MDRLRYAARRAASSFMHRVGRRLTPAGWLVLAGLASCAVVGIDTNRSMAYQGFTFFLALLTVSACRGLLARPPLEVARRLPRFGTAGQPLPYEIRVTNPGAAPQGGLSLFEELPDPRPSLQEFRAASETGRGPWFDRALGLSRWRNLVAAKEAAASPRLEIPDLAPRGTLELQARLLPRRRGRLTLSALTLARPDPLGLWRSLFTRPAAQSVLVLPRRYPVPRLALSGRRSYQPGGVALSSAVGESQEFVSLRDYRPGDPLRRVHWKSWARTGRLIVKEHHDEYFVRHGLVLDTFTGSPGEAFEEAVSVAASFASCILTQDSLLDLLFVGAESYCFTAGRGLGGAERLLEVLAVAQACSGRPFEELRQSVLRRRDRLSGVLLILLAWDEPRARLVSELAALGIPALTVVVTAEALELPPGVRRLEPGRIEEGLSRL